MSFVDKVVINIKAGDGGNGKLSFRHEKFINKGGPDGGDGGDGGSIIFEASNNQNTLTAFRYKKSLTATAGSAGGKNNKHGRNGQDLVIKVPLGTVFTANKQIVADLTLPNQQVLLAKGGKGGYGNAHFVSSTRQAPNFAEKGEPGESRELTLELKMIADVGLVGLPNAGKSTLLSRISHARPEIADYPFTTLRPNLGVVDVDKNRSLLLADIPGLIEGAALGKGLGHDFLRHIERTHVILHLVDAYSEDVIKAYLTIRQELEAYDKKLAKRPEIVVLTKIEGLDQEIIDDLISQLKTVSKKTTLVLAVSSFSAQGIKELIFAIDKLVTKQKLLNDNKKNQTKDNLVVLKLSDNSKAFKVKKLGKSFLVSGESIDGFANRTDFNNPEAIARLFNIMKKQGIIHELNKQGLKPDQTIRFSNHQEIKY